MKHGKDARERMVHLARICLHGHVNFNYRVKVKGMDSEISLRFYRI